MKSTVWRKFLTAVLAVICIVCVAAFAACAEEVNYYNLTCEEVDGMEYAFLPDGEGKPAVMIGARVKEGYVVRFKPEYEGKVEGTPVFKANNNTLSPDGDGVYSFTMTEDVKLSAEGFTVIPSYEISFNKGTDANGAEGRVQFFVDGEPVESVTVEKFEDVYFTVKVSSYYKDTYTVLSNTTELEPVNGVYTIKNVTGRITVTAYNLEIDDPFVNRENGGDGSRTNPFKISRPIDMYYFADIVNDSYYNGHYGGSYYELTNDIDMDGEQLYVIGDMTTQSSYFYGNFNGNGHTVSNFRIEDYIIEQQNYTNVKLPYLGVFGFAAYGAGRSAEIYNFNVKNFTIDADISGEENFELHAGGIVGHGIGVNISGCSAQGTITVDPGNNYACVGGIIGIQQSYYDGAYTYYSSVSSSHTDVDITSDVAASNSGSVSAAGGIVGLTVPYAERIPVYIFNCYTTGDIRRVLNGGGIAGYLRAGSSVGNAYSTGRVNAVQTAGGIAGLAEYATVISDCYSNSIVSADSGLRSFSVGYGNESGYPYIECEGTLILNCYPVANEIIVADDAFFKNTLHWDEADWKFTGGYPELNMQEAHKTYSVTLNFGSYKVDGQATAQLSVTDAYATVAQWNIGSLPEFVTADNGYRSYGYYFDEGHTQRVPFSYVPTRDITLYAGFANYSEVVGTYYISGAKNASVQLTADGELVFRSGAMNSTSYYTYNGEEITLYDTVIARLFTESDYYSFKATLDGGTLKIYDNELFPAETPLTALRENPEFGYGTYYDENGTSYTFNRDGSLTVSGSDAEYVFAVTASDVIITGADGAPQLTATVAGGSVTHINGTPVTLTDAFAGVWEKSATSNKQFTFDGKGLWSYKYFGYNSDGSETVHQSASGSYEIQSGEAVLKDAAGETVGRVAIENGFLSVTYLNHNELYYKQFSYTGTWRFFNYAENEPIQLELMGIGTQGYGNAVLSYSTTLTVDVTYETYNLNGVDYIAVYEGDMQLGYLTYNKGVGTLTGAMYSVFLGSMREDVVFCLYDDFTGEWVSNDETLSLVRFNGLGSYDLKGTSAHAAVRGLIWIEGRQAGTYKFENSVMKGSFTYRGVQYTLEYSETDGKVIITYADGEEDKRVVLVERDDWFGNDLIDGDGNIYSFDGRGNLDEGGTMTQIVAGQDVINVFTYKITATGLQITGSNGTHGTITAGSEYFLFDIGNKQLNYLNGFGGSWLLGGEYSYISEGDSFVRASMTVGKITPELKAAGTFLGNTVEYVYDKDEKTLSFVYDGSAFTVSENGGELYVNFAGADGYIVCIREDEKDGAMGVYTADDGSVMIFDGLGASNYGSGSAFLVNGEGLTEDIYSYTYSEYGYLMLISLDGARCAFVESADGKYAADNGKKYDLVRTRLYNIHVVDAENAELTFVFDGVSKLIGSDGTEYTYDLNTIEIDELNQVYTIYLNGAKFVAKLDYSTYTVGDDGIIYYHITITSNPTAGTHNAE